jgi:hypothetical protein
MFCNIVGGVATLERALKVLDIQRARGNLAPGGEACRRPSRLPEDEARATYPNGSQRIVSRGHAATCYEQVLGSDFR